MTKGTVYNYFIKGLRLIYRAVPFSEGKKLRWVDSLSRFRGFSKIVTTARRQVEWELATAHYVQLPSETEESVPVAFSENARPPRSTMRRVHAGSRAVGYVPDTQEDLPQQLPVKVIAFYLPQFHPIPENDKAWGVGFTEWANVTRALPQVEGQVQPRLPGELGFYDLRLPSVQERQVELAKQYGLSGFCFHFYWFGGKRLLEGPLLQYLENPKCDLSFCLCWANENWTRRWDGFEDDVLVSQNHSAEDDIEFIAYISKYFTDSRYIRVDGKPLLVVYRPTILPNAKKTAMRWRKYCLDAGIGEIFLATTTSFGEGDPGDIGFDALIEFAPNNSAPLSITSSVQKLNPYFRGNVFDWRSLVERSRDYLPVSYRMYRGVNPGWDNTPRKPEAGNIFLHSSPRGYEEWLYNAVQDTVRAIPESDGRLVFANAWNEWAEGAYLEPDSKLGYAYLAATRRALKRAADNSANAIGTRHAAQRICVVVHAFYPDLLDEMLSRLAKWSMPIRMVVTTCAEREAEVLEALKKWDMDADCRIFENRGRDILPFLHVANELADAGETLVVKLHTKRSPHRGDGDVWRRDLLDKLIQPQNAKQIEEAFREEPQLGMVGPEGHILPISFYWGSNEAKVQYLCRIMGVGEVDPAVGVFSAGSMFWIRIDALRPLLDIYLDEAAFEEECGQLDGTMAHAIERCLAPMIRDSGYFLASSELPTVPAKPIADDYGFAESSRRQQSNPVRSE